MADDEPLLFRVVLGTLRPMSGAAEDALRAIGNGEIVRIEVKKVRGNIKRLSWYWVMLRVALENLGDAFEGNMTTGILHKWLKRRAGLAKPITSRKTGEIIEWDYGSIAFQNLPELERAEFIDFASKFLAARLGCDPDELMNEAKTT